MKNSFEKIARHKSASLKCSASECASRGLSKTNALTSWKNKVSIKPITAFLFFNFTTNSLL